MSPRQRMWSPAEVALLCAMYPHCHTADVAAWFERSLRSVYQGAQSRGLKKDAEYLASDAACQLKRGKVHPHMTPHRWPKGHAPWNTGLRGVNGHSATRFPVNGWQALYGPEIGSLHQLRGALARQIKKTRNLHEHQAAH
jgi:hypothetical protein